MGHYHALKIQLLAIGGAAFTYIEGSRKRLICSRLYIRGYLSVTPHYKRELPQ